jgi:hypothetical protein
MELYEKIESGSIWLPKKIRISSNGNGNDARIVNKRLRLSSYNSLPYLK